MEGYKPQDFSFLTAVRISTTPYNFIIAAKNSPYNCSKFDATSEEYFNGMLDGIVSNEKFNDYMMRFPKREDF